MHDNFGEKKEENEKESNNIYIQVNVERVPRNLFYLKPYSAQPTYLCSKNVQQDPFPVKMMLNHGIRMSPVQLHQTTMTTKSKRDDQNVDALPIQKLGNKYLWEMKSIFQW